MTQTIEQLTARIERLNYSLVQEIALSDRLKAASRMPGTGNYVEWIETIRNSHDQAEHLQAKVAELEEEKRLLEDDCGYQMQWKREFREQLEYSQKQLAVEQLNNKRLRDELRKLIEFELLDSGTNSSDELCYEYRQAVLAYNTPSDTSALDGFVAEKVKEIESNNRDACLGLNDHFGAQIKQLTRQRDLAVSAATKARNAAQQCASVCSKHLDVYPALLNMIDVVDCALAAIKESEV